MASSIAARSARQAPIIREPVPVLMRTRSNELPLRQATEIAEKREQEEEKMKMREETQDVQAEVVQAEEAQAEKSQAEEVQTEKVQAEEELQDREGAISPPGTAI